MSRVPARGALALELACAALAVVATAPLWLGRVWYLADLRMYALPDLFRLQQALAAGELRAWDPALFCGYPALAGLCAGALYPPVLLASALLPTLAALSALVVLHAWWLARGAVALARELGASRRGGLLAAASLLLGGSWSGHALDLNVLVTLAWTPWVLCLAARAARRPGAREPLLLAGAFGVMLFQTSPQWALYLSGMALVVGAALARDPGGLLRVVLGLGLAGLLAAPLLLPGWEYLAVHPRERGRDPLVFAGALGTTRQDLPGWLLGGLRPYSEPFFPGAAIWALALLRLLQPDPRDPLLRVGAPLAALGLLLCGGEGSPLFRLLVHVPPFGHLRCPARILIVSEVGLALLAAGGLGLVLRARARPGPARLALLLVGLSVLAAIAGRLAAGAPSLGPRLLLPGLTLLALGLGATHAAGSARRAWTAAALAALLLELGLEHRAQNPSLPAGELLARPALAEPVLSSDDRRVLDLASHHVPYPEQVRRLRRNSGALFGVQYFSGYESLPPRPQEAQEQALRTLLATRPRAFAGACAALSLRWVVVDEGVTLPGFRPVAADAGARLWEHPAPRPRAYLLPAGGGAPVPVALERPRAAELRVLSDCPRPARLVVAEAWYPGWTVALDGARLPDQALEPAPPEGLEAGMYLTLDGLPAGRHEVVLRFESATLELGLRLGLVSWLAWAAALGLGWWLTNKTRN